MKTIIAWIIGAAILIIGLPLQAADITVAPFKAPSPSGGAVQKQSKIPDLREGFFHGFGKIDRISPTEVVVEDRLLRLLSNISYRRENGSVAADKEFTVGTLVWYVLDNNGNVKSLWKKGD
ncbi:MAG: hypothetical protein ABIL58_19560 [Pseudomonadota bacterium]